MTPDSIWSGMESIQDGEDILFMEKSGLQESALSVPQIKTNRPKHSDWYLSNECEA